MRKIRIKNILKGRSGMTHVELMVTFLPLVQLLLTRSLRNFQR